MPNKIYAVETMVYRMKARLDRVQANITVSQSRAKSRVSRSTHDDMYQVGEEMVLATCMLGVKQHHLPYYCSTGFDLPESRE